MVIRNAENHAKIAAEIGWKAEDVAQFIVQIDPMADGQGYLLFPHQNFWANALPKPLRLGNDWVIKTGPIDLEHG